MADENGVVGEDINERILSHALHGDIDEYQAEYLMKTRKRFRAQALAAVLQENGIPAGLTDN